MKIWNKKATEWHRLVRAYGMLAAEVGHVMAALVLYREIVNTYGLDSLWTIVQENGQTIPVLSAMIATGKDPDLVQRHIQAVTNNMDTYLRKKEVIVCVGTEAAWLDYATRLHPDKQFYVVPHAQDVNVERILANYKSNVRIFRDVDLRKCMKSSILSDN